MFCKKCTVEYDGTMFAGWQTQPGLRTVQREIEKCLSKMYKSRIIILGSGRTDSGVHALGQVFSFISEKYIDNRSIVLGLNSMLPDDISVSASEDKNLEFHAQKSAVSKTYLYKILNSSVRRSLMRNRVWWFHHHIDENVLCKLLKCFEGERDFSAMCTIRSLKLNSVRKVFFTNVVREGELINIEVNANGFLHNMVRNIVGTAIFLYRKGNDLSEVSRILDSRDRKEGGPTAPAQGLYLKDVFY